MQRESQLGLVARVAVLEEFVLQIQDAFGRSASEAFNRLDAIDAVLLGVPPGPPSVGVMSPPPSARLLPFTGPK